MQGGVAVNWTSGLLPITQSTCIWSGVTHEEFSTPPPFEARICVA